jgi:hypothetical protein
MAVAIQNVGVIASQKGPEETIKSWFRFLPNDIIFLLMSYSCDLLDEIPPFPCLINNHL